METKMTKVEQAKELGKAAFHNGINAPIMDPDMVELMGTMGGEVGCCIEILEAWVDAWTVENINAPVDGLEELMAII